MTCPSGLELTRALSEGARDNLAAHLASCKGCRTELRRLERARELARRVGAPMPSAAHCKEVRTALLTVASSVSVDKTVREKRWRIGVRIGATLAVAAALVAIIATRSGSEVGHHRHGTLRAQPHASVVQTWLPDEIVVLHDGVIEVDVDPLHAGERFRVIVGDSEIEVYGTAFEVTARAGRLVDVAVRHGVVEVRSQQGRRMLTAGHAWREPIVATTVPALVAPPIRSDVVVTTPTAPEAVVVGKAPPTRPDIARRGRPPAVRPEPAKPQRLAEELAYDDAWAAMRSGRFTQAAGGFARAQLLAPTGPLAEDSGFWYAVALARSGQPALASTAFRDYLVAYPRSRRAGEASAMLGWLLVEAGDAREAEQRFRVASTDPSPDVRASAVAGLAAVAKMQRRIQRP